MTNDRMTILIVDDVPENLKILGGLLKDQYRVHIAKSGQQVLKSVTDHGNPDLILLDVVMPGMDGYEVCTAIKGDPKTADIPIIFVTSKDTPIDEVRAFDLGAADFITKPYDPNIVLARVRSQLESKAVMDTLMESAYIDGLTQIYNRRKFDEEYAQYWQMAQRTQAVLSVGLIDIDHFKQYNDTYGHGQGDVCLHQVAQAVNQNMRRQTDFAARYGGEEFVCVFYGTDCPEASEIMERTLEAIRSLGIPHEKSSAAAHVTVSAGLCTLRVTQEADRTAVLQEADKALYEAKEKGRNRVVCHSLPL